MTDHTRSDIRLGDLSALDAGDAPGPRVSAPPDTTAQMPRVEPVPPRRPAPRAVAARPAWWLPVLAGTVVVLLGVVIFLFIGQRDLARSLATLEARADASVASLEDKVASTSTTLRSADSETQKSLNLLATDIGKLDGSLGRLGKSLDQQAREHAATAAELKALAAEVRRDAAARVQADGQRDGRLKALADGLEALAARQKTQADALARLERSGEVAQLRSEVAVLGTSLRDLEDDLGRRLKAAEQAAASNDAFRRQVNATIDRLNQQVGELYQKR